MNRQERLLIIKQVVEDSFMDVHDLVELLEITVEDVLKKFPTKLLDCEDKFTYTEHEDGDDESMTLEELEEDDEHYLD